MVLQPRDGGAPPARQASAAPDQAEVSAGEGGAGAPDQAGSLSIAVLPFVNMSPDKDNEYFSDGISEELLNVLAKVNSLRVASRTSAFAYKGKELPVSQIASELAVDNVVEGSVRKAGNRVRITAQLIDGHTDRHIWSDTYERQLDDIFEIQEEISNAIVDALKIALNVDERQAVSLAQRPTDDPEAYEIYLRGRSLWRQRGGDNVRAAIALFHQAVERDPDFAAAWESLAAATGSLSNWSNVTPQESLDEAIGYARKALALDPKRAEARAIVAEYHGQHWEWAEMMDEYRQVIADAPNSGLLRQWRAEVLENLGYSKAALEEALKGYELDPALPVLSNVITYVAYAAGRDDLSLKHWKIASELGLERAATNNALQLLVKRGEFEPIIEANGWTQDQVPLCLRAMRDPELVPKLAAAMQNLDPYSNKQVTPIMDGIGQLDMCYALVGDDQGEMDMIESGVRTLTWYGIQPLWFPDEDKHRLRQMPQFKKLVRDMGLVDYWREAGWPDLCHPKGEDDFECD